MTQGTVVLLSGGMDSAVALHWAARERDGDVHGLAIEYGQRHWQELSAAKRVAYTLPVKSYKVINYGPKGVGFGSLLTEKSGTITTENSVVPARNVLFLGAAAVHAKMLGADRVVIGSCLEDQEGYADCRPETIEAAERAFELALERPCAFIAPFAATSKADICRLAKELGPECLSALRRSWSCYDPQPSKVANRRATDVVPCEVCPACVKRIAAFEEVFGGG